MGVILTSQTPNLVQNKTGNVRINVSLKRVSFTIFSRGKVLSITYSEGVFVAVVIQHVMRMRRIILSSVASQAISYLPTLFRKLHDFLKKKRALNIKHAF